MPRDANMTIGHLARTTDVNVETIRYYQKLGLLALPPRPGSGFRRYGAQAAARLRFIRRAQQLGFTLEEVRDLLKLEDGQSCEKTRALAERKLGLIEDRLADLTRMRRVLRGLIAECESGRRPRACPIIDALSGRR